jgi:hypothetical protein
MIGFFERYLTIWVALCIVGGILLGQAATTVSGHWTHGSGAGQSSSRRADLGDDHSDAGQDRFRRNDAGRKPVARHWRHVIREMVRQNIKEQRT